MKKTASFERKGLREVELLGRRLGRRPGLLAGVSGGADSVALLRMLCSTRGAAVCRIQAVNCNFHLRGPESDSDSAMVASLCDRLGVRLHRLDFDTREYIRLHPGTSEETACRLLRYRAFRDICRREGLDRVAVAHNLDDNAETLLLNLMRGSGSKGLKGMRPDTPCGPEGCAVLRPLLAVSRREIEDYLAALGQDYVTDSSNLRSDYARNFLRLEVLPLLASRWPAVRESLAASASILAEENALVSETLHRLCPAGSRRLEESVADGCGAPVSLLLHFIAPFGGTPDQAAEMARTPRRVGAVWVLTPPYVAEARPGAWIITENIAGRDLPPGHGCRWSRVKMTPEEWHRLKKTTPFEGIYLPDGPEAYEWRRVRRGDRMRPLGMKGSKAVSDLLKEAGVPVSLRPGAEVLVRRDTGDIIWLRGIRRSALDTLSPDASAAWRLSSE
ncbi:MAG: tRNA lysidine(34) synthetase TilS [Muribaculaceae bacterium]|nr:tRNA lysidine(34) synthetase TilS [Muribaculaceae bacterium]